MNENHRRHLEDAKHYSQNLFYYNQYEGDRLISSLGFPSKALAENFARRVDEEVKINIEAGQTKRIDITAKVEEAVAWSVRDQQFDSFSEALVYKWEKEPKESIKGIFAN